MSHAIVLDQREDGIAVLTFDQPGRPVNVLDQASWRELDVILARLSNQPDARGLLVRGGKPGSFIVGADLNEIALLEWASDEVKEQFIDLPRAVLARVRALPFPTVGLIDGACLGGGLEFALALDERIATDDDRTLLGLPAVRLGLLPCWGGTQSLPRLLGVAGIELLATGEIVNATKAMELGLVGKVVPADLLFQEGVSRIHSSSRNNDWRHRRVAATSPMVIEPEVFSAALESARITVKARTNEPDPVGMLALEAVEQGALSRWSEALSVERDRDLRVLGSARASNLIALSFLRRRASRKPRPEGGVPAQEIRRVGVLGAGQMGVGIASAFARAGIPTTMIDVSSDRLRIGMERLNQDIGHQLAAGRCSPGEAALLLENLSVTTSLESLADRDLVLEAIPEDQSLKSRVIGELAHAVPADAIVATNTSSISIDILADVAYDATRFIGIHFFYPVSRMELVEIVRGTHTSDQTIATAVRLARRIGKVPILVRDGPGFLVSRVFFPYLNEALFLLEEGADIDSIDAAAVAFGMPMGPIAVMDLVGLDTVASAAHVLAKAYPERARASPLLDLLVDAGRLGRKSGRGFRCYERPHHEDTQAPSYLPFPSSPRTEAEPPDADEITERLILTMLLEAARALEEGIASDPGDVDLAMVLATGFPPWKGGLFRWFNQESDLLMHRVWRHRKQGPRFQPPELLLEMARGRTQA